jgi:CheY-like chemotaxis protein
MAPSTLRILVVDDYEPLRYLKARLLREAGAIILEASTGAETLRLLAAEGADLVLIDVNLPDMSGVELRNRMRSNPATAAIPVIYTSASERPPHLNAGEVFVQEPIDAKGLIDVIEHQVGHRTGFHEKP